MQWLVQFLSGVFGLAIMCFYAGIGIGSIYWLWIAIQIGSFWMFLIGIAGPTVIITGPVGLWSLLFEVPTWVLNIFA
jgi:hypothetical protein